MVEARDIIARTFRRVHQNACYPIATQDECELVGTAIIEDLRAAGWTLAPPGSRVVPEGGVDAPTVERCATLALQWGEPQDDDFLVPGEATGRCVAAKQIAAALRALAEAKP